MTGLDIAWVIFLSKCSLQLLSWTCCTAAGKLVAQRGDDYGRKRLVVWRENVRQLRVFLPQS